MLWYVDSVERHLAGVLKAGLDQLIVHYTHLDDCIYHESSLLRLLRKLDL
jgi:hypothetical protein